ncbi:MAG: cytochrome-c peroxidase [Phycisphaerae bacterium]|nr:cytochrome-c peroxidase [Phycisphaerae bacterium]
MSGKWLLIAVGLVVGVVVGVLVAMFLMGPEPSGATPSTGPSPGTGVLGPAPGSVRFEPIQPIPQKMELDEKRVALGERLFHDGRLSSDGSISCASCHNLNLGGTDRKRFSNGVGGALGDINSPTVFNSGFNFKQFWNGRADTLEDQIDGPVQHPKEMNSTWPQVVKNVKADPEYASAFDGIYPDGVTPTNIKDAIATFERSLFTPDSRFDQYLRGDENAITQEEKDGYDLFKTIGCTSCHQGMNVGGNMFERFGVMANYFTARGNITEADYGRFNVTKKEEDKFRFRVASLRNVAITPPYFHDGTAVRLEDAVRMMARYNLGRKLSDEQVGLIVKFLRTLTGKYKGQSLEPAA